MAAQTIYGTTQIFLDHFGLANLQQLNELDPTLQRSNPRLKAEQYKRVEKKTELEKAAEEAAKEAGETPASPVTDDDAAPPVADDEMEDLTGKAGILPADTTAASEEDDFFIDDTPDEFDDEDEDDEDEDEDIDEEEEEDEDDK